MWVNIFERTIYWVKLKKDEKRLHFLTRNLISLFEVSRICSTNTKSIFFNMMKLLLIEFMFIAEKFSKTTFL